jgi:hypothetical protein
MLLTEFNIFLLFVNNSVNGQVFSKYLIINQLARFSQKKNNEKGLPPLEASLLF